LTKVLLLLLFLFVDKNHNCQGWTPNKKQATFLKEETDIGNAWWMVVLEKETYLQMVEKP